MVQLVQSAPPGYSNLGPLPVCVRTKAGELIGRGTTDTPIEVPAGSYYVTVLLPDGREVGLDHRVRAGAAMPPPGPEPAGAEPAVELQAAMPPAPVPQQAVRDAGIWRGDWLAAWAIGTPDMTGRPLDRFGLSTDTPEVILHEAGDRLLVLALEDRDRCTIIPFDECKVCIDPSAQARAIAARLTEAPDGPAVAFRSIVSEEANALLGFVEGGVLGNMVAVTEDEVRRGEQALSQSGASVLRAITGAYVLLRANELEGLDRWLAQLEPFAADLPDLRPLQAELAARTGDHRAAVAAIRAWLDQSRCPWFRAGLSYMLDRLRLYLDVSDNQRESFNLDPSSYRRFEAARDVLERMLPAMLTSRYIATFDIPRAR
jgi:hypothetical protein